MQTDPGVHLSLPGWAGELSFESPIEGDDRQVRLAIDLSRRNVEAGTGGPFGAAVFGADNRVVAVGVNAVLALRTSVAHAEMLALVFAQQHLGRSRLNRDADGRPVGPYTLAASSQPCSQCYGALMWAGIDRLIVGARAEDVTSLTAFDEGPLPADWIGELQRRGIEVVRDAGRDEACAVLRAYAASGGPRY